MKLKATQAYDHYYNYQEITALLQGYAKDYPDLIRLSSLNTTKEGREIWLAELTNTKTGDFGEKPAYFLNGHVHAGEVTGSMCAMYFIDHMLTNYKTDASLQQLLDSTTFYIIPRVSPDGAEYYLTHPDTLRSLNEFFPFDEPQPGLQPADLDGDGVIRNMLVPSPYGVWKKAADDPRMVVKRRPDEMEGVFYNIYNEGMIDDYDGFSITPAPANFGLDLNRNFPVGWETNNKQAGAGHYALDRLESRTLAEFLVAHKNICNTINFHTFSGLYLYPPGMMPSKQADPDDMKRYRIINKMVVEETGFAPMNIKDDFLGESSSMRTFGSFDDFLHFGRGIYSYTIETWDLGVRSGMGLPYPDPFKQSDEEFEQSARKLLNWMEENDLMGYHKGWTPFEHPQLGPVEIGGVDPKYLVQNPPVQFLPEEVEKHTRFILRHAHTMPHVALRKVELRPLGGDLYKVEAYVCNTGFMPTHVLNEALTLKLVPDIAVELSGEGVTIEEGRCVQEIGQLEGFSGIDSNYFFFGINTNPHKPVEKKVSWVVKAPVGAELTVTVCSQRAGSAKAQLRVEN